MKNFFKPILVGILFGINLILIAVLIHLSTQTKSIPQPPVIPIASYEQETKGIQECINTYESIVDKIMKLNIPKGMLAEVEKLMEEMNRSIPKFDLADAKLRAEKNYLDAYLQLQKKNEMEHEELELDSLKDYYNQF